MIHLPLSVQAWWDRQHRHPQGLAGQVIGARMARQHRPETDWSVELLGLAPTDRVLEIGFGAGRALDLIARQVPADCIVGVDVSRTMVAVARRRNATTIAVSHMVMVQGDVARLPLGAHQVDKILSVHTYYFWTDPLATLAQLVRNVQSGGRLVVTLSTGIVGAGGARTPGPFGTLQSRLEQEVVPHLLQLGCTSAVLADGPDNRQGQLRSGGGNDLTRVGTGRHDGVGGGVAVWCVPPAGTGERESDAPVPAECVSCKWFCNSCIENEISTPSWSFTTLS